ncbi:MAG: anti-anti-sigma factor [Lysobacterales bacterium 69-70]|nr:MAG: anti-anti-sigma factor [Xanthomonadaceae bacterium SCN 69-320]ODV22249.1 MAG: anti-anti-sigma factor [Xanthomonadaceae bacterium SCN 69-25]OJY98827.1 MAG: anti-anti-sigma factor [Xanthomonadales bacterium 69-70]
MIIEAYGSLLLIRLSGEVDLSWSGRVRDAIIDALEQRSVGVDLSAVSYIDSSGIAALVEGLQTARDGERRFVLVATSPAVLAVLELARLDRVFTLLPDLAALEAG